MTAQTIHVSSNATNSPLNTYLEGFLAGAQRRGADVDLILRQASIPSDHASYQKTLNGEQLQRLILSLRQAMDDHNMGFLNVPGKLAMDIEVGRVAFRGNTLGESARHICAFINAIRHDEVRELQVDNVTKQVTLRWQLSDFIRGVNPHTLYWYRLLWGYKFYCWLIGERIKLTSVTFTGSRCEQFDYEEIFNCPVLFNQGINGMSFDHRFLRRPIVRDEMDLLTSGAHIAHPDWFVIAEVEQSISARVDLILRRFRQQGMHDPELGPVAEVLAMSSRSLSAKLLAEGTSFSKVKARQRCLDAQCLLKKVELPISDVAERMGYSEPGAFTRAFIKWTGQAPSVYRAELE